MISKSHISIFSCLYQKGHRILQQRLQVGHKPGGGEAVNDPMVAGETDLHDGANHRLTIYRDNPAPCVEATLRMAALGWLIMAVNSSTPYIPRLLIEKVLPACSSGNNFLEKVRSVRSLSPYLFKLTQTHPVGILHYRHRLDPSSMPRHTQVHIIVVGDFGTLLVEAGIDLLVLHQHFHHRH